MEETEKNPKKNGGRLSLGAPFLDGTTKSSGKQTGIISNDGRQTRHAVQSSGSTEKTNT